MCNRAGILTWKLPLNINISCLRGQQSLILSQAKCQSHTNVIVKDAGKMSQYLQATANTLP